MRGFIRGAACLMAFSALVGSPPLAHAASINDSDIGTLHGTHIQTAQIQIAQMQVAAKPSYCHKWASSLNARARSFNAQCAHRDLSPAVYNRCKATRDRIFAEQQRYHRSCGR